MKQLQLVRQATVAAASILFLTGAAGPTPTKALFVANNGVDSTVCGEDRAPCRSIRQAIANASAGSLIIVGPGRYGDLNGNGVFGEPGEEGAEARCACMIELNKPLEVVSREGASATVLDATGAPQTTVVRITANDAVFGRLNRGFTLRGGINSLVVQMTSGVAVQGNRAIESNRDGFLIYGVGNTVRNNQALGNAQVGFFVNGQGHQVLSNEAIANRGPGFWINEGGHTVRRNVAIDNGTAGFMVGGRGHTFRRNVAVANRGAGILANTAGLVFKSNDLYGNYDLLRSNRGNCGIMNASAGTITATHNFWGAETGPGWDPADDVCETAGGNTEVKPYAVSEFGLRAVPLPVAVAETPR